MRQNFRRWGDAVQISQGPWGVSQMGETGAAYPRSVGRHAKLLPLQWAFWQGVLWAQISHRRSEAEARSCSHSVCPSTLFLLQRSWLYSVLACYPTAGHHGWTKRAYCKWEQYKCLWSSREVLNWPLGVLFKRSVNHSLPPYSQKTVKQSPLSLMIVKVEMKNIWQEKGCTLEGKTDRNGQVKCN